MNLIKIFIIIIMLIEDNSAGRNLHELIYQKDVSEHCRRRVIPSIFLGRQVVNANSQILQFSRLELPYSCFISIRTESGSNMIMMIQLASDDLKKSCSKNSEQLLVYEIGETFGGYWGPLPDSIMRQTPYNSKFYTIKTTHETTSNSTSSALMLNKAYDEPESDLGTTNTDSKANETKSAQVSEDFVDVEVPLVNVSVRLVPGGPKRPGRPFDPDVAFDIENNVTPIPGVSYDTRILPLVQFSIREDLIARRLGEDDAPKYELDIVGDFTPDMRKIVPRTFTKYQFPTKVPVALTRSTKFNESWHILEDIIRKLEGNVEHANFNTAPSEESMVLESIAKLDQNISAYLLPQWSHRYHGKTTQMSKSTTLLYNKLKNIQYPKKLITSNTVDTITYKRIPLTTKGTTKISSQHLNKTQADSLGAPDQAGDGVSAFLINTTKDFEENAKIFETSITESTRTTVENNTAHEFVGNATGITTDTNNDSTITGSMVDHESWENLVQAAPEMAVKLNRSVDPFNDTGHGRLLRKKREIHSINIENARPHNMTLKAEKTTTTTSRFRIADMQEFAQLVELQDNELHGRVALRYLRQYVGPALYNLCDTAESPQRHVHLFNSSRIVLAISNFTLDRMIIILTSARTLLSGESSCPSSHLECQVSGARVCLDSTVACDGVPNCGSFDIYDEDRLLCGASKGLQHNVYLAAFTFLAALLTVLYVIHYWLKRCVPKVADAFFIYTNGVENVLFLDTIMRSPNDTDDLSKMIYQSNFFGDGNIYDDLEIAIEPNLCRKFLKKCCFCLCKKQTKRTNNNLTSVLEREVEVHESFGNLQNKRLYSFTYPDINDVFSTTRDTAIQTGESLEMQYLEEVNKPKELASYVQRSEEMIQTPSPPILIQDSVLTLEEPLPKEDDELSLMKFFREVRKSDSFISDSVLALAGEAKPKDINEIELISHSYDRPGNSEPGPSRIRTTPEKKGKGGSKHLRFDDVTTTIPIEEYFDENEGDQEGGDPRRSVQLLENKHRRTGQHLDTIDEDEEQSSTLKDAFHFWGSSKQKKSKKKPQNPR